MGRYALLVATGAYDDVRLARLRSPASDVERLAAVLEDPDIGGFTSVTVLRDRSAGEIRLAVEDVLDREPGDLVLVFFACHGVMTAGRRLHFAASDTNLDRPAATAVPRSFVHEQLADCAAGARVLVLDCRFGGVVADPVVEAGEGYVVLSATDAFGQDKSVYTDVLIEGLSGGAADLDGDGWVEVAEWAAYAARAVGDRQTPLFFPDGTAGAIRIGRAGTGVVRVAPTATYTPRQLLVARGFRAVADRVCRTLGPYGRRAVLYVDRAPVEAGDASTIVDVFKPDDSRDLLGVEYARDLVREVRSEAGDGGASAVAVTSDAVDGLVDAMRSGAHPIRLLHGIETAARRAVELIITSARDLVLGEVGALAGGVVGSAEAADVIVRVADLIGLNASFLVDVEPGAGVDFVLRMGARFRHAAVIGEVPDQGRVLLLAGRFNGRIAEEPRIGLVVCLDVNRSALKSDGPGVVVVSDPDVLNELRLLVGGQVLPGAKVDRPYGNATRIVVSEQEILVLGNGEGRPVAVVRTGSAAEAGRLERAARVLRGAAEDGVLRGQGIGLRAVGGLVTRSAVGETEEELGIQVFGRALGAVARWVAENSALDVTGLDASSVDSAVVARVVVEASARTLRRFLLAY
ncbi:hypothetical protein GCM10022243_28850 [Saccharothrix violaceirubra]|uniref:Chaperonin GroEL n=1 Tax=Saccharothrix violaceirubra TaxID=413306 RepID=A0A7W7T9W4_9PSEU|nr:caspase family protein [Saccharothrix violaceirubra]MBB4969190.1 chaperonin GroEL [Saccharothrix violaceirubra]